MTTIGQIYQAMDEMAPFRRAESWDNSGLLLGEKNRPVERVVLALDATVPVVEEAARLGADLLLTHHPVIFHPLKKIPSSSVVARLIQKNIGVISAHTNLDLAQDGVNDQLALALGLCDITGFTAQEKEYYYKLEVLVPQVYLQDMLSALIHAGAGTVPGGVPSSYISKGVSRFHNGQQPVGSEEMVAESCIEVSVARDKLPGVLAAMKMVHPYEHPVFDLYENQGIYEGYSLGRMGRLPEPASPEAFAQHVKKRLGCTGVRLGHGDKTIVTVAVCGGSGGSLVEAAIASGADALVTSEIKHDQYLTAAQNGLVVIDAGHHSTEAVVLAPIMRKLQKEFPEVTFSLAHSSQEVFTCI